MIIQCPACATRYVVPETAIGLEGRTVRCAKCRHSWFQAAEPHELTRLAGAATVQEPERATAEEEPREDRLDNAVPAAPEPVADPVEYSDAPSSQGLVQERDPEFIGQRRESPPPMPRQAEPADDIDAFDANPPFRRRRNPIRMWWWAAGIFAAVALALSVAVSFWGLPDWVPVERPTFGAGEPDLQLDFPPEQQERRELPNGTEFFGASGSITNIGTATRQVPTILIVMRDARDRIVYSWEVIPPKASLAPGEVITVNEAVTDIPRSARFAQIGWKPE